MSISLIALLALGALVGFLAVVILLLALELGRVSKVLAEAMEANELLQQEVKRR